MISSSMWHTYFARLGFAQFSSVRLGIRDAVSPSLSYLTATQSQDPPGDADGPGARESMSLPEQSSGSPVGPQPDPAVPPSLLTSDLPGFRVFRSIGQPGSSPAQATSPQAYCFPPNVTCSSAHPRFSHRFRSHIRQRSPNTERAPAT